jgi:hypothetical protein
MRFAKPLTLALLATASIGVIALPVLGRGAPESILPPGFGDPPDTKPAKPSSKPAPRPAATPSREPEAPQLDIDIDAAERSSSASSEVSGAGSGRPSSGGSGAVAVQVADGTEETNEAELLDTPIMPDLPPYARRPVDLVGVIGPESEGLEANAFGATSGRFLGRVLNGINAPVASRWASITLRRALLSRAKAPAGIDPADWVAERTWLLLKMGEADPARMLAQGIDSDRQTAYMRDMALQAALASADPASACPAVEHAPGVYKEAQWMLARAVCNALSGESAQAAALVDSVADKGLAKQIDTLLAEKVVGAAGNTRRSVKIQWDKVTKLTNWRFGMATATGVEIPATLLPADAWRMRAWRARAPLRTASARLDDALIAAGLGVFSNQAMVDLYGAAYDETDPAERSGKPYMVLRDAYAGGNSGERLDALRKLWGETGAETIEGYGRLVLTARAVALLRPEAGLGATADQIVSSLLTAGFVDQASGWLQSVDVGSPAWAQIVSANPDAVASVDPGDITGLDEGKSGKRAKFFLAGMAGLGKISTEQANDAAESLEVALGRQDAWTRALEKAVLAGEQGTVVVLTALGLQGNAWGTVDPVYLYRAVSALNRVGLTSEARLIAAEAVARG